MPTFSSPAEIARETLKQLMTRRMAPSPENYRDIYAEIAGVPVKSEEAFVERELKSLLVALPRENAVQQRLSRQLEQALKNSSFDEYRRNLADFVKEHSTESELSWGELIGELLRQWESKQTNMTAARKREALERVLGSGTKNGNLLFGRLQGLVRSWSANGSNGEFDDFGAETSLPFDGTASTIGTASTVGVVATSGGRAAVSRASEILPDLRELFAYTMDAVVAAQLGDEPELAREARSIAAAVRGANSLAALQDLLTVIKRFAFRLEFIAEDRAELHGGLLRLLQLTIDNISELVVDDRWLNGQIDMVREIIGRPMNVRAINDAEKRIKEVIFKQSQLKYSLTEAREALKQMLAGFVDHLADFADSTSDYQDKMEVCVRKISKADDISQLQDVLGEVIKETRTIQLNAQRSRDDLRTSREHVEAAEKRINELQSELEKASLLVRHDQLTGALNRRGLEESFDSEVARARRRRAPLCVALLDVDNFKALNDSLGHATGDAALIHLVSVIRDTLRPQDTLARSGGEEFVVLLPDTTLGDAKTAIVRLQRELTRRFFLADNEKILITFSAGVTQYRADDNQESVVKRADEAMYTAKKAGKNRVVPV